MPERLPPPPPKFSWARLSKTVAFWMIVILVPVIFFQLTARRNTEAPEIAYSEFVTALERGNVRQVEVEDLTHVRGEFKSPERIGTRHDGSSSVRAQRKAVLLHRRPITADLSRPRRNSQFP